MTKGLFGPFTSLLLHLKKKSKISISSLFPLNFWTPINCRWQPAKLVLTPKLSPKAEHFLCPKFISQLPSSTPSHLSLMADNGTHDIVLNMNGDLNGSASKANHESSGIPFSVPFLQKLIAEVVGTYFLIFAGCGSVVVNKDKNDVVTLPGIAIVWGLVVTVLIYSVGHISGAHFNPAVTIAFASTRRFPLRQVPAYIVAQMLGSTLASGTLRLLFGGKHDLFAGTLPSGSNMQSFVVEFIITFYLMFVISGVATDNRAIGELAGIAVGSTILLNVMLSAPITGASMNPARSLGPAIVANEYKGIWIYVVATILGAIAGAWVYNTIRYTEKPLREITKSASFLKAEGRADSN